jgi:hypothetical protein
MKKSNKLLGSKSSTSGGDPAAHSGGNSGRDESELDQILKKLKDVYVGHRWLTFDGGKQKDAHAFINQFREVEDVYPSEKLLDIVKAQLTGRALMWYRAHEEEEFTSYGIFKEQFIRRFSKEEKDEDKWETLMTLYSKGPQDGDVLYFAYDLKRCTPKGDEYFRLGKLALEKHIPKTLREEWDKKSNFAEVLSFMEENEDKLVFFNKKYNNKQDWKRKEDTGVGQEKNSLGSSDKKVAASERSALIWKLAPVKSSGTSDTRPRSTLFSGETTIEALLDTGAQVSLIDSKCAAKLGCKITSTSDRIEGIVGKGVTLGRTVICIKKVKRKTIKPVEFWVIKDMSEEIILGINDIYQLNLETHLTRKEVAVATATIVSEDTSEEEKSLGNIDVGYDGLSIEQLESVNKLVHKYIEVFCAGFRQAKLDLEHAIELTDDFSVVRHGPRRRSPEEWNFIEEKVQEFLDKGFIERSQADYSSPVVLAKKPLGGLRFCIDYRKLNSITKLMFYPIPLVEETLEALEGATIFSVLDLEAGYHQVRVRECDRYKTTFSTRTGSFQWLRMPFGLINAPFTFQKIMNTILSPHLHKFVKVYLDDIMIYSKSWKEHLEHLDCILGILDRLALKANATKCHIAKDSVDYLGYHVDKEGIKIPLLKQTKCLEYKMPTTRKEARSFIGFSNYFRKFIDKYTEIMAPIYDSLKKGQFVFTEEARASVLKIKERITADPILKLPDFTKKFILYTDASNLSIGGALMQVHDEKEHPVYFISRKLNSAELNYTVTEKECLAVVWCVTQFRIYLTNEFIIRTDHQALKWLLDLKDAGGRIMRWILTLQNYTFKVEYIKGSSNVLADGLTRLVALVNNAEDQLISEEEKRNLILQCHEECGHGSVDPTYLLVLRSKKWQGMYRDVRECLKLCQTCLSFNKKNRDTKFHRLELGNPFSRVGIDVVGPLPRSERGKKYLIVATDYVTRWCEARATKDKSARTIAKFVLEEIICRHGPPNELLSDRGLEFLNKTVAELCNLFKIYKSFTSAYHPQCNGAVERTNQSLVAKLAKLVNGKWKDWDEYLELTLYAYRISPRKISKFSPFELLYGRKPVPWGEIGEPSDDVENNELVIERLKEVRKDMLQIERDIRDREMKDTSETEIFSTGDVVMRRKAPADIKNKLDCKFEGPYQIIKVGRKGSYTLMDPFRREFVVNKKDIKLMDQESPTWDESNQGGVSGDSLPVVLSLYE